GLGPGRLRGRERLSARGLDKSGTLREGRKTLPARSARMPGPTVDAFHGDETLPATVDVVVIGGGIIGAATALELAERGLRVARCEKGAVAAEQSSRNGGWVRISRRDPREVPLMAESLRLWRGMDARLGRPTGYVRSGIVFACEG